MSEFFIARNIFASFRINKSWVEPFRYSYSNLNSRFESVSEDLRYTGWVGSFFSSSRSEERVVGKCIKNFLVVYGPKVCEVLQLGSWTMITLLK